MDKYSLKSDKKVAQLLNELNISLAISTYQAGRVVILSSKNGETISQVPIPFKKPMGIACDSNRLAIALLDKVQIFSKCQDEEGERPESLQKFENLYIPLAELKTGELDLHDLEFGKGGLWAVNTRFSCLSNFDMKNSFNPMWKPAFISTLSSTDKCHLNGMAVEDGVPIYATALGQEDEAQSWRKNIVSGGVLIEIKSGQIILDGLAMPHSPRLIDGQLFLLQSAKGELVKVNVQTNSFEVVLKTNGFLRGMSVLNNYAFIGVSQARKSSKTFDQLPVTDMRKHAGIIVFDLEKNEIIGEIKYETTVEEIFDVRVIKDSTSAAIVPFNSEVANAAIVIKGKTFWNLTRDNK